MAGTGLLDIGDDESLRRAALASVLTISGSLFGVFLVRLYRSRKQIARLKDAGLPVAPKWSWLFGNLLLTAEVFNTIPSNAHKTLVFTEILRRYFPDEGACYLDLWPVGWPFLMIMSPDLATQAAQTVTRVAGERPPELVKFFNPLAGGPNLFDLPEKKWKRWRIVFNKGFSSETLSSLIPGMVQEAERYLNTLEKLAKSNTLVQLDRVTLRFTLDFIGRTTLNASLEAQKGYSVLADSMLSQVRWMPRNEEVNPLEMFNVPRYVVQWWNGRKMDKYIGIELDKRFDEHIKGEVGSASRSVIDLVLQAYLADAKQTKALDPVFRAFAINQIRLFLFVGHDSMSSTIVYALHLLSQNPKTLAATRNEHDKIFGMDLSAAPSMMVSNPAMLNQLPYTAAVIKETLRMFPPGSGIRQGSQGGDLIAADGTRYPTENTMVWILHTAMHRAPEYWVEPDAFLPERWLVEPGHKLHPRKGAWRPFEWGPRNCIGQSLAMKELLVTLVMVVRAFNFAPAYDEWDRLHPRKGIQTYRGERAYQIEEAAAHPANHYPCRISIAQRVAGDEAK